MPKKYPDYPYREPAPAGLTDPQIVAIIDDLMTQNPWAQALDGGPLDALCRALTIDLEYSGFPNEVLMDVPRYGKPVVWLDRNSKTRYDRFAVAIALGHWVMDVLPHRDPKPDYGIQALYDPSEPLARSEARKFAFELLMPSAQFQELWHAGRAQMVSDRYNLPTQLVYDRAKMLMLEDSAA